MSRLPDDDAEFAGIAATLGELRSADERHVLASSRCSTRSSHSPRCAASPMTDFLPAWSEPFHGDELGAAPLLALRGRSRGAGRTATGRERGSGLRSSIPVSRAVTPPSARSFGRSPSSATTASEDGDRFVEGPHDDLYGHGTACAAIVRELAPEVELISVRVLSSPT